MITSSNELRQYIEIPEHLPVGNTHLSDRLGWRLKMFYASTMSLIQIAQELNEIKHILAGREQQNVTEWIRLQRDRRWPNEGLLAHRTCDELIRLWQEGR